MLALISSACRTLSINACAFKRASKSKTSVPKEESIFKYLKKQIFISLFFINYLILINFIFYKYFFLIFYHFLIIYLPCCERGHRVPPQRLGPWRGQAAHEAQQASYGVGRGVGTLFGIVQAPKIVECVF
jgi:hypothetical protein